MTKWYYAHPQAKWVICESEPYENSITYYDNYFEAFKDFQDILKDSREGLHVPRNGAVMANISNMLVITSDERMTTN